MLLGALFCVPVYAAQIVAVTASGHDSEKGHVPANIADGDVKTRWAASGDSWIQLELDKAQSIENILIVPFKATERKLKFAIAYSTDGKTWQSLAEGLETITADKKGEKLTFSPITPNILNWKPLARMSTNGVRLTKSPSTVSPRCLVAPLINR